MDADRLPVARGERWAATWAIELIGRVLIAVAYGDTPERAVIDQIHIEDALTLLTTARRDVGKLEAQLITAARHGI